MKVADIKLEWDKSVSVGLSKVVVTVTIDGVSAVTELTPDVQEQMITVAANKPYTFSVETFGADGLSTMSVTFSGSTDDLTAPQPATNLRASVMGIRDVPDVPTP